MVTNSHGSQVANETTYPPLFNYSYFIHLKQWCWNIFLSIYTWDTVMFPGNLTKKMLRIFLKFRFPSQVTIDGEDVENMNQLVRQVAYLNTRCHHYNFKNTIMFFMVNIYQSVKYNSNNNVDNNNNDKNFQRVPGSRSPTSRAWDVDYVHWWQQEDRS